MHLRVLQCVAVCCRVLQGAAGCCRVLQCVAVCCSVLQSLANAPDTFECNAPHVYMSHVIVLLRNGEHIAMSRHTYGVAAVGRID